MSNPRRGFLAAGLASAVVGSMGIVWTISANADETPEAEAPVAVTAPVADAAVVPAPVPPKLLPWGTKPHKLKRARAGASSKAVAAAGADAAPADTSGSLVPEPEFAPKGRESKGKTLKSMRTTLVPPAPPGVTAAAADETTRVFFHYAVARQKGETDGTWANLTIEKPKLAEGDYHTLAEIAVQSEDGEQTVEVGWNVDRAVNGDSDPHLFVYYWRDNVPTCYNACGFTMYSKTVKPGDTLPVGAQKRFGIQHASGVWWVAYDSEWIGYFSDKNWEGRFTKGGQVQWFGEVASPSRTPCSAMGNGKRPDVGEDKDKEAAARIGSISLTNGPEVKAAPRSDSPYYGAAWVTDRTFRYGGPGAPVKTENEPDNPC